MRHQKSGRKFARQSGPRHALFSNLVTSLIEHERIETTDAKAKELRRIAERTISWATSVGNLVGNEKSGRRGQGAHRSRDAHGAAGASSTSRRCEKLFKEIGPRLVGRPGGYTAHHEARLPSRRRGADVDRRVRRSRGAGGGRRGGQPATRSLPRRRCPRPTSRRPGSRSRRPEPRSRRPKPRSRRPRPRGRRPLRRRRRRQ